MAEVKDLIKLMHEQMQQQARLIEGMAKQRQDDQDRMEKQRRDDHERMDKLLQQMSGRPASLAPTATVSKFAPFDPTAELWTDYYARFCTFLGANSIPDERKAQVFLTNQTATTYKLLTNLAVQQSPPKDINDLSLTEIVSLMKDQFDPKRFVVRERFRFWSDMQRRPGESIQELAARIRQDAATCDFSSIKDPQDEALRTRFICSVNNEAVLKALFKVKDDELDFTRAIEIATETEDAAKVAKETVYGNKPKVVQKVDKKPKKTSTKAKSDGKPKITCYRCGIDNHKADVCHHKDTTCRYCKTVGHLESVCRKKQREEKSKVKAIHAVSTKSGKVTVPKLEVPVEIEGTPCLLELDTATTGNFISKETWKQLGRPALDRDTDEYESASKHHLPTQGTFMGKARLPGTGKEHDVEFTVTDDLNLLGRVATKKMQISVDQALKAADLQPCYAVFGHLKKDDRLQDRCRQTCKAFPNVWKQELGCLKDFELEVEFKRNAEPIFCKARPVPIAIQDDLEKAYQDGIAKGTWEPVQFNDYGTPVVPVKKAKLPGQEKAKIRVCGDYSVTVNRQLKEHRHPIPLPEELMRKLGGGYGFTKIDLADAYNQIKLGPRSQQRLALNTHKGVLLQKRLPFGIKSAPGYFQQIMDQLTQDLPGVAVYLDDLLVSGKNAEDHIANLQRLLQHLDEKGLRCRLEKCQFAQPWVEYLGHLLSAEGIAKGPKVDDVLKLPAPTDVASLRSFLGSVQFYAKFLPPNLATIAEPLYRLTKKSIPWSWKQEQEDAFKKTKELLSSENVLVHYSPALPVGISCDASNVGIGAVLFHRYPDGSERPIANVSKILTGSQRNYSQIHKEALAIIYGLKKFYQYVYGRKFILVTDHRPLRAMFGPGKATPALAANRLSRWAMMLNQFDYDIEYRKTTDHANADVLSRLPVSEDAKFDGEEAEDDCQMVCAIDDLSQKLAPADANSLSRESAKDPVIATVMRFTREGWPPKKSDEGSEMQRYRQISGSLAVIHGCLIMGSRVVVPASMRRNVLDQLHIGHFGMERMKQLARTSVYWPNIQDDIEAMCRSCVPCGEHQNKPSKPANHPWMLPEKPWSRLHIDHAINFLGSNWLVMIDSYSKYPCIHPTQAITAKATTDILEEDFAHFGYPHTLVTDNATTFMSEEFQSWCKERGITHLTGAPYHPATNGAAERLVQTFKQALRKSSLPPRKALQQFLMQYRRMPNSTGYSPSELLNSRQIRTKIDVLLPSPAHAAQGKQAREATKSQLQERVSKLVHCYKVGDPVYALYCGPRRDKEPRWVPAVVTKRKGTRSYNVRVHPRGPTWRRHLGQLQPRHVSPDDTEPGDPFHGSSGPTDNDPSANFPLPAADGIDEPPDPPGPDPEEDAPPTPVIPPVVAKESPRQPRRSKRETRGKAPRRFSPSR